MASDWPAEFPLFARTCRALVDGFVFRDETPAFLVATGDDEPTVLAWTLDGAPPAPDALVGRLLANWIGETGASQVAVSVPLRGRQPGVLLVMVDEACAALERSSLDLSRMRLGEWRSVSVALPILEWQRALARNAGWRQFAKYRCRRCHSICAGEADEVPTPCAFCGGTAIDAVGLATPLRDPDPPYGAPSAGLLALIEADE